MGKHYDTIFCLLKEFFYIVPMKSRGEIHLALKMFSKEIGVSLSLIIDPSGEQTSTTVTKMWHKMGTSLKILEESTQHAKLSERYVGLTKTLIRKDQKQIGCTYGIVGFLWWAPDAHQQFD